MATDNDPERRVFAYRRGRRSHLIGFLLAAVVLLAAGFSSGVSVGSSHASNTTARIFFLAAGVVVALLAFRLSRTSVSIDRQNVTIRRVLGTRVLATSDVSGFDFHQRLLLPGLYVIARRDSGRRVTTSMLTSSAKLESWRNDQLRSIVQDMNVEIATKS